MTRVGFILKLKDKIINNYGKTSTESAEKSWYVLKNQNYHKILSAEERERARRVVLYITQR